MPPPKKNLHPQNTKHLNMTTNIKTYTKIKMVSHIYQHSYQIYKLN